MDTCNEITYKKLFFKYGEYLRNFIYYKSGDLEQAEDVSQEAFIKLWENCKKVSPEKAKSYLFTVANNLFLNKKSHEKVVLAYKNKSQKSSNVDDPHFELEKQEFAIKLQKAINELPENQRVVFLMNRIDKKKYKEIAEELNLSQKAIEKRMHLALKALKKIHNKI